MKKNILSHFRHGPDGQIKMRPFRAKKSQRPGINRPWFFFQFFDLVFA